MGTPHAIKTRHLQIVELTKLTELFAAQSLSSPFPTPCSPLTSHYPTAWGDQHSARHKRAVLKLGLPESKGIPVSLQIGNEGALPQLETTGWLPLATELLVTQAAWQQTYCQNYHQAFRIHVSEVQITNVSYQEETEQCRQVHQRLTQQINSWLNSELFRPVRETLLSQLHPTDMIRLVFQTDDVQIRALPLHVWDWFDRYPQAELVLSQSTYCQWPQPTAPQAAKRQAPEAAKVKILAVLGDSQGLDLQRDLDLLRALPDVALTCLVEPERSQLNDALWEQSWDILFFAGHSRCTDQTQQLRLNANESLSLHDLKHGLRKATVRGLKLAIFNACDGLKLLKSLSQELVLPTTILMRHPVPDKVAQAFLKYFLNSFSQGIPLHLAVREAREQLEGLESQFPFASWLPVLWQNPSAQPITWTHLKS
ncbi:MAG: CHAT domain [Phormidesmis priestleyi Ana]|uniref:CHAT domain n=1 Tax=Phormidesmis priestleyi Ana TaxID=1666911 RepID=A0A0P7ZJZ8_9CYAN|nr:MAG: CHAT domain [Phormidesmis priestleyi Ana]